MTAVTATTPAAPTAGSASAMAGVPDLTKLITRRERIRLPIWCYATLASVGGTAYSFKSLYATAASASSSPTESARTRRWPCSTASPST